MSRLTHLVRFLSPWIVLGLAGALVAVYLRPALLPGQRVASAPAVVASAAPAPSTEPSRAPSATRSGPVSYAEAIARAAPAVVNISTKRIVLERRAPNPLAWFAPDSQGYQQREETSRGSGVILDAAGHIATNYHVIQGMQDIVVQLVDGRSAKARLVGTDPDTDLAVLQVRLDHLPVMPLGRSDRLRVGDVVLAIGFPLDLGQTVTQGICSATGRSQVGLAALENFIQTDAAINQGNSGGALVTADGELVGINSGIKRDAQGFVEGVGFAIPVNLMRGVIDEIEARGRVTRGWSGIEGWDLRNEEEGRVPGFLIGATYPGGPADRTGLHRGDVLLELEGTPIIGRLDFLGRIARRTPGSSVVIKGVRPGAGSFTAKLPVVERPAAR